MEIRQVKPTWGPLSAGTYIKHGKSIVVACPKCAVSFLLDEPTTSVKCPHGCGFDRDNVTWLPRA